jgi:signal transduction histidine kinase
LLVAFVAQVVLVRSALFGVASRGVVTLAIGRRLVRCARARPAAASAGPRDRRAPDHAAQDQPAPRDSTELRRITEVFNALVDSVVLANETRQQLLAGVSHDLRTPMSRLRLRIETQVDPAVSDELLYDLHGLERIVAQFLAYVHGQAHHEAGVMTPLRAVVEQVGSQLGCLHVRAELDTCMKPVPDLAVQRLLDNLIDNAMAHGAGPVTVRLAREAEHCVLTVFDHGPGLSATVFAQALQPFARLEASRPARAMRPRAGDRGAGGVAAAGLPARHARRGATLGFGIAVRWSE